MTAIIRVSNWLTSFLIAVMMSHQCGWAQAPAAKSKLKLPPRPYEIVVQSVEVKPTRLDGSKWDPQDDSPPDLYVTISRIDPMLQQSMDALRMEYQRLTTFKEKLEQQAKGDPGFVIPNPGVPPKRPMPAKIDPRQIQKLGEMTRNLQAQIEEIQTQHRIFYKSPVYPNCLQAMINGAIDPVQEAKNEKLNDKVLAPPASASVHLRAGDQVTIKVFDSEQTRQLLVEAAIKALMIFPLFLERNPPDELIGVVKLTVTSEMIKQGRVELSFGLVSSLVLQIKPKQP